MLLLTRKTHQAILIDGQIEVSILEVRGNRVKLGINAPERVSIRRNTIEMELQELDTEKCGLLDFPI